jgi:hypothetical protein
MCDGFSHRDIIAFLQFHGNVAHELRGGVMAVRWFGTLGISGE